MRKEKWKKITTDETVKREAEIKKFLNDCLIIATNKQNMKT